MDSEVGGLSDSQTHLVGLLDAIHIQESIRSNSEQSKETVTLVNKISESTYETLWLLCGLGGGVIRVVTFSNCRYWIYHITYACGLFNIVSCFYSIAVVCYVWFLFSVERSKLMLNDELGFFVVYSPAMLSQTISVLIGIWAVRGRLSNHHDDIFISEYIDQLNSRVSLVGIFFLITMLIYGAAFVAYAYGNYVMFLTQVQFVLVMVCQFCQFILQSLQLLFILADNSTSNIIIMRLISNVRAGELNISKYMSAKRLLEDLNSKSFWLTGQIVIVRLIDIVCAIISLFIFGLNVIRFRSMYFLIGYFIRESLLLAIILMGIVRINEHGIALTKLVIEMSFEAQADQIVPG